VDAISEQAAGPGEGWKTNSAGADIERLWDAKFATHSYGDTATGRQREAGTGYFDKVAHATAPDTEPAALPGAAESAPQ
jgi:hypothetical protein